MVVNRWENPLTYANPTEVAARKFSIMNAIQNLGTLACGAFAVWIIGQVEGQVAGLELGFVLRVICTTILVIGLLLINVVFPVMRRRQAKQEADAYAQSFRDQLATDAKRIDDLFGIR